MFDGQLFQQALASVRGAEKTAQPILNYMLTMYGHSPFELDADLEPTVVSGDLLDDSQNRMVNTVYYRTHALAQLVRKLRRSDPESLLVIASDHQPPIGSLDEFVRLGLVSSVPGGEEWDVLQEGSLYIFDRGELLDLPPLNLFEVRDVLLSLLAGQRGAADVMAALEGAGHGRRKAANKTHRNAYYAVLQMARHP